MKLFALILTLGAITTCEGTKTPASDYSSAMNLDTTTYNTLHNTYKEPLLQHRRFKHADVDSLVQKHKERAVLEVTSIGKSFEGRAIYELQYGVGDKVVMLWSQMHGDEPTATMALFDLFNFLEGKADGQDAVRDLLKTKLNLHFIPMLNPDGADRYTRRTGQSIDMNRDARAGQTVEGALLKKRAQELKPRYGFNLHDQNIYYNVPETSNPVQISLLAPAYNYEREINEVRGDAMKIIVGMNQLLQQYIPNAVAKYDDAHTPRGFGDNFQSWGASTVLIESGGRKGDPEKQEIRKLNFIIILNALIQIAEGSYGQYPIGDYEKIPFNASQLHDVVIRNITIKTDSTSFTTDLAIRRGETTVDRDYFVRGRIEDIGDLQESFGYDEVDVKGLQFIPAKSSTLVLDSASVLSQKDAFDLLKKGIMAVPVKTVGSSRASSLHNYPIHFFTQKQFFPTTSMDLGGTANFYVGDANGKLHYAVFNGYLIDLSKEISGLLFKSRVH